jgi:uncharacterized protein involved in exopolysaccharide biosynthesis
MEEKNNIAGEKEIDLLALANKIWANKKFILKALGIGLVIGLIVAFSIPKEYTTMVVLVPDGQSSGSGTMGSLAAMAGINLGNTGSDALASPNLYPSVFESTPFIKGLFNMKVKDSKEGIDTTLYSYMNNYQKSAWWTYIFKIPGSLMGLFPSDGADSEDIVKNSRVVSKEEKGIIEALKGRIIVSSNKKTAATSIEVTMQSPEISAYLVDTLISYFQSYIIDYRTQKARNDLEYVEKLYMDSKNNYQMAQQQLAAFIDGNLNVVSAKYRINQDRLQNEASLAYSVYNQTAQQLQMARVKVQDNTPVFTVIQPAVEPLLPVKPQKKIIVVVFLFLSFIGASIWVLRNDIRIMLFDNN